MITSNRKICPMCQGIGYFSEAKNREEFYKNSMITEEILPTCEETKISNSSNVTDGDSTIKIMKNQQESEANFVESYATNLDHDFVIAADKLANVQETLRLNIKKLKLNDWESNISALLNIVKISSTQPEIVDSSMPLIMRSLHGLMRNVRPQVVRTACQIAEKLFKTMQCTQKPEFDELVSNLLQKTCHMKKTLRQDANKALDTMIIYIQASHCLCALSCPKNAGHKNPVIRATVSRLLYNIVYAVGAQTFLTMSHLRDARRRTFVMCIEFLNDPSTETRSNTRRLMQMLMRSDDFDHVFNQDVERSLIMKIEKQLVALKYEGNRVE